LILRFRIQISHGH
jgi:hypothetical protein